VIQFLKQNNKTPTVSRERDDRCLLTIRLNWRVFHFA